MIKTIIILLIFGYFMCCTLANAHIYEANDKGQDIFLKTLADSKAAVIIGSYKIHKQSPINEDLQRILKTLTDNNIGCSIILEDRLTSAEVKSNNFNKDEAILSIFKNTGCRLILDLPHYSNVHFKILVNKEIALIGTTNYADGLKQDPLKRDFTILIKDPKIVTELYSTVQNLIAGKQIIFSDYRIDTLKSEDLKLSWGPTQHMKHFQQMINSANKEIAIYQQDIEEPNIINSLINKLKNNTRVRIIMSEFPFGTDKKNNSMSNLNLLSQYGAKILIVQNKLIHAKALIIDNKLLYLGSANFYPNVLDSSQANLNLGIITNKNEYVKEILKFFEKDWHDSQNSYYLK